MHVSINIPFTNVKEFAAIIESIQKELNTKAGVEIASVVPNVAAPEVKVAPAPKPKKKAAPPQPEPAVETPAKTYVAQDVNAPIAEAPKAPAAVSIGKMEVTSALQTLNNKKGLPAARIILAKFKTEKDTPVQRLSELKVEDYGQFHALCMAETEA